MWDIYDEAKGGGMRKNINEPHAGVYISLSDKNIRICFREIFQNSALSRRIPGVWCGGYYKYLVVEPKPIRGFETVD